MRNRYLWLGFAAVVMTALAFVDGGDAQPPGKKGKGFGRPVTTDQIVERIMAFDKNGDGKITIDELPERMQHLIALGDLNKDGALDKDEIQKLATTIESFAGLTGGGIPGGGGPKGGGPKGGGPKGPAGEVQRVLDDLDLRGKTRDKAQEVASAHQQKVRRFEELTRAEVIMQMKEVLNEDDFRTFKTALDNGPFQKGGPKGFDKGGPKGFDKGGKGFGGPKETDLNKRIDQIQKELEELRAKVAK